MQNIDSRPVCVAVNKGSRLAVQRRGWGFRQHPLEESLGVGELQPAVWPLPVCIALQGVGLEHVCLKEKASNAV